MKTHNTLGQLFLAATFACSMLLLATPAHAYYHKIKSLPTTCAYGFVEPLPATGPMAEVNAFRFSTKSQNDESELFYGYRYYSSSTGKWLSRDPYGELGFLNVTTWQGSQQSQDRTLESDAEQISVAQYFGNPYQFCWGDSVSKVDLMGLVPQGKTFFGVYLNYGDYKTEQEVWKKIGGTEGTKHIGQNSCAARVSAGLNQIEGEKITGLVDFINSVPPQGIAGRFISNARRMNSYLTRKWGTKSECSKTEAYYFKSKTKKGDFAALLGEIVGLVAKCKCGDDFEFVAVVSSLTPEEPQVSGHVGVVTRTYHDSHTPYGDFSDVWLLPPTLK